MHTATQKMHAKYGPVVRMAPNYIDLDYEKCAGLIKTCFDTKGVWRKVQSSLLFSMPSSLINRTMAFAY